MESPRKPQKPTCVCVCGVCGVCVCDVDALFPSESKCHA